jgi:hypothetical protein
MNRSSVVSCSAAGHLVEEADNSGQPSVGADGRDIGADHQWLVSVATQTPAEPGDVVVGIDPAGESEDVARELALGGVDRIVSLGVDQRIDVAGVVGPGFPDQIASGGGVSLVPAGKVALDQIVHGIVLSQVGNPIVERGTARCRLPGR